MNEFKVGDVVYLKSGSPAMTIAKIVQEEIGTIWYNTCTGEYNIGTFQEITLSKIKPK